MTSPLDVLANALSAADPDLDLSHGQLAEVVADALNDRRIAACAVARLELEGREITPDLLAIVRTVLGSVGGA